ncbi:MAG: hypothetical protein IPP88_14010 [Betaproteobacteria bacterium]|nr:hypothetical protein [Betaproteobacteria bacterium]
MKAAIDMPLWRYQFGLPLQTSEILRTSCVLLERKFYAFRFDIFRLDSGMFDVVRVRDRAD